jgi:hypothetical protein
VAGAADEEGRWRQLRQSRQIRTVAKNLKGKLLLAHGTTDANVPPYNTLLVVNELIKHNKDFDLLLLPNRGHGFGSEPYMVRRRWDYFVRHLLGAEPRRTISCGRRRRPSREVLRRSRFSPTNRGRRLKPTLRAQARATKAVRIRRR